MNEDRFVQELNNLFPNVREEAIHRWINFANDCVEREQYVDFEPVSDKVTEAARWLESLFAGLIQVKQKYGEEIARQMVMLAEGTKPLCLYPCEMPQVAELLRAGATQAEINHCFANEEIDGEPPFFPKLSDIMDQGESDTCIDETILKI